MPHFVPGRQKETVVAVLRDGELVASIYGSREGIHIVSERLKEDGNVPFFMTVDDHMTSWVVPLLKAGEECPWCAEGSTIRPCPVCARK